MKPILFNTEMVRAILEGRKTVTRRVVKPKHLRVLDSHYHKEHPEVPDKTLLEKLCLPPYHPGDILWVRETWAKSMAGTFMYRADDKAIMVERWHPSIHMPREAARIFLRVTGVRVERLQEMTLKDAAMEGMDLRGPMFTKFVEVWNSTVPKHPNKFKRYPYYWEDNPWVWVIEFERISKDEALGGGGDG